MQKRIINKAQRNERILLDVVEQYIKTAEPVSSQQLLFVYKYNLSSATLRNTMASLGKAGYLVQPYTSAGRVPTAKAYRFYVDKVKLGAQKPLKVGKIKQKRLNSFQKNFKQTINTSLDDTARILSQQLAEATHSMAFVGLMRVNHFYREGLGHLLNEPEFLNAQNIRNLIEYADSLGARLDNLCANIQDDIGIFIGEECQVICGGLRLSLMAFTQEFSNHSKSTCSCHKADVEEKVVFGIVGPMRMHYSRNLKFLDEIRELFK